MTILNPPKILLVTDDVAEESHTAHILTKYHFTNFLIRLRTAKEALKYFSAFQSSEPNAKEDFPELIILSLRTQSDEYRDLAEKSRQGPLKEVPLIIVTGDRTEEGSIRDLGLQRTFLISRPIGFFKLLEGMQKLGMFWVVLRSSP
jgi:DNA-binding response OmpR family regulator